MSDVLPKMKLYLFLSIIVLIMNFGIFFLSLANTSEQQMEIGYITNYIPIEGKLTATILTSFIPFTSIINPVFLGLPFELSIIYDIFIVIISSIQSFIIAMILLGLVKNILWSPDV